MKKAKVKKKAPVRVGEVVARNQRPIQEKASLKEAGEKMRSLHAKRLSVAAGDLVVGMVEGNDPDCKVAAFGHDPADTLVRENMVRKTVFCREDESLEVARKLMDKHEVDHIPVVDSEGRIVGMIAREKLAKPRVRKKR